MLTLEAVRAAAISDQPWSRLDELVRAELATGRKVADIADEFDKMAGDVWRTPELSEDGHDAFGDTLDALLGNCHSNSCYQDPPNDTLPTEEEIATLPRWAQLAFAARCTRRLRPLFELCELANEDGELASIDSAIHIAEHAADTLAVDTPNKLYSSPLEAAFFVLASGMWECGLSRDAAPLLQGSKAERRFEQLLRGFVTTADRLTGVEVTPSIRRDFDNTVRLADLLNWAGESSVSPTVFGPLWPEGPPPGWPADPDLPQRTELPFTFLASERSLPVVMEDHAVNLFNALNRYYIARTGHRLTLEGDIHTLLTTLVGVEA